MRESDVNNRAKLEEYIKFLKKAEVKQPNSYNDGLFISPAADFVLAPGRAARLRK